MDGALAWSCNGFGTESVLTVKCATILLAVTPWLSFAYSSTLKKEAICPYVLHGVTTQRNALLGQCRPHGAAVKGRTPNLSFQQELGRFLRGDDDDDDDHDGDIQVLWSERLQRGGGGRRMGSWCD
jgi:hypothetical protein